MYKKMGLLCIIAAGALYASGQKFKASFSQDASNETFSGNVFLYLSKDSKNPKDEMIGVERFPCFSIAVNNIKPGDQVIFDDAAIDYPVMLSDIERGQYNAQVVWDRNEGGRSIANSPGNMYNETVSVMLTKNTTAVFDIVCKAVIKEQSFTETQYIKEVKAPSALLLLFIKSLFQLMPRYCCHRNTTISRKENFLFYIGFRVMVATTIIIQEKMIKARR